MKIVFWGSSDFSMPSLKLLHENHHVLAVVTNTDSFYGRGLKEIRMTPVKQFALEHSIKVIQPVSMKDLDLKAELETLGAELFVIVSFGMIIPDNIIYMPKYHSINLHASLLPTYRGASPIQAALFNGDQETGNSVQYITKELDRGDIILQRKLSIEPDDLYESLSLKLSTDGAVLLEEAIVLIETGKAKPEKQDNSLATYCKLIKKEHGCIRFADLTAQEIVNRWRAYHKWPGIFGYYHNSLVQPNDESQGLMVFFTALGANQAIEGRPGTIITADKKRLVVAAKKGAIEILRVKPVGKKEMDVPSFMNGYKPQAGSYF